MRTYIIGNDGATLCREPPAELNHASRNWVGVQLAMFGTSR